MNNQDFQKAVIGSSQPSDPTMIEINAELSKANLARIRGNVDEAKAICLRLLKNHPRAVDPHVLLGDLNAEQGLLKNAVEWYSLALDLDPQSPGVLHKREKVELALQASGVTTQNTYTNKSAEKRGTFMVVGSIVTALAIASAAFFAGAKSDNPAKSKPIADKISAPAEAAKLEDPTPLNSAQLTGAAPAAEGTNASAPIAAGNTSTSPNVGISTPDRGPLEERDRMVRRDAGDDASLFDQAQSHAPFSDTLVSVMTDPRANSIIITYNVNREQHGRYTGACLAVSILQYHQKADTAILRGIRGGVLAYMADVSKAKLLTLEAKKGSVLKLESKGWIDELLENEYYRGREYGTIPSGPSTSEAK